VGVDGDETVGLRGRHLGESLGYGLLEVDPFVADPITNFLSSEAFAGINGEENDHAGPDPEQAGLVHAAHPLDAEAATGSLVRKRRVHRSIRHDPRTALERRTNDLSGKLCAGCGEEQCFGPRLRSQVVAEENLPDRLANGGSARLAHTDHSETVGLETGTYSLRDRRLARSFDALERDVRTIHVLSFLMFDATGAFSQSPERQVPT
jgi:hypothetical protein